MGEQRRLRIIPEVFDLDDQDYLHVLQDEVTPENEQQVEKPFVSARDKRSRSVTNDFPADLGRYHRRPDDQPSKLVFDPFSEEFFNGP